MKKYDIAVYIGRFQPLHNGHAETLRKAADLANRVVVIIGSAFQPRTHKNPFTYEERQQMVNSVLMNYIMESDHINFTTTIKPNIDTIYDDDAWVSRVQDIVSYAKDIDALGDNARIAIIGHDKDEDTKRYLRMFPQWDYVNVPYTDTLDATQIRQLYFNPNMSQSFIEGVVPDSTYKFLEEFDQDTYDYIVKEKEYIDAYKKMAEAYPYPIIGVTVDSIVTQAGHILLVKRRSHPGKGLWAIPGGYFDAIKDRTPLDAMLRELREETKIDLPDKVLRGSLKGYREFCAPGRSLRGRSITFAGHFRLTDGEWGLPKVKGADDAEKAKWVPFSQLKRDMIFEDHADIIQYYVPSVSF